MAATKAKGEFKNKITKAQEDLFKALDQEKVKRTQISNKIVQELNKQGKANLKTLSSLNKEYLDHVNKNDLELQTFIDKVNKINEDLELCIKTYNETYNVDDEKNKLIEQKDKVVAPLKTRFKREIHDINIKIDRIDKELKETLEDRLKQSETEAEDYKDKLLDFEKRKRIDIASIQNNTIKAYDDVQKKLLVENKRQEIKKHKKAIKEIRYQGLVEEKECLLKYCDDQMKYELDYAKHELEVLLENSSLVKEYNTRIENTKFDRSMIEFNFEKEFDRYDNEAIHNLNIVNKDMEYKQNAMKEILYKNIYESSIEEFNNEQKKHDDELNVMNNIYTKIFDMDNKQIENYLALDVKDLNSIDNSLKLFSKNINTTLTFYLTNIISMYHAYFKELFHKEEKFLDVLLVNRISGEFLNGYSFEDYSKKVAELFTNFSNVEEATLNKFEEILHNLLNNLLTQVEVFITSLNEMSNQIHATVSMYHDNMRTLLNEGTTEGANFFKKIYEEKTALVNNKLSNNKETYDKELEEVRVNKEKFDQEFIDRENEVKLVEEKNQEKYQEEYKTYVQTRDNNIVNINNLYDEQIKAYDVSYNEKIEKIKTKFASDKVEIEKEYKVKMGLL